MFAQTVTLIYLVRSLFRAGLEAIARVGGLDLFLVDAAPLGKWIYDVMLAVAADATVLALFK